VFIGDLALRKNFFATLIAMVRASSTNTGFLKSIFTFIRMSLHTAIIMPVRVERKEAVNNP
jgi:hypothetical protein